MYVIGTEVPVPGGATEAIEGLETTTPAAARATIDAHREAFHAAGLERAWERVIASVVQPGVEFDHHEVIDYVPAKAKALSEAIVPLPGMVYEAHSTDYQTRVALQALVRDHFAILKVGPGLTFALREALWALDAIERDWIVPGKRANLRDVALQRMREQPKHWQRYYHADGDALTVDLQYSLSDRIRYYWPDPVIEDARARLFANLRDQPPPLPLLLGQLRRWSGNGGLDLIRAAGELVQPLPGLHQAVADAHHQVTATHADLLGRRRLAPVLAEAVGRGLHRVLEAVQVQRLVIFRLDRAYFAQRGDVALCWHFNDVAWLGLRGGGRFWFDGCRPGRRGRSTGRCGLLRLCHPRQHHADQHCAPFCR